MVLVPLWLLPYLFLIGGGYWLGEAIRVPAVGVALGIAAAIAWGWWRWRVRENAWIDDRFDFEDRLAQAYRREQERKVTQ